MTEVTLVVPTHGRTGYLKQALASAAADTSASVAVIVVEDGAHVADEAALRRLVPEFRLVRLPPSGRSAARNEGVNRAETEFVAFLDDDDLSLPSRFGRQAAALRDRPGAALCFGGIEAIDGDGRREPVRDVFERERFRRLLERGPDYEGLLVDCPIYTSATMVRRDVFLAVGGYRTEIHGFEDLELYLRLAEAGELVPCAGDAVAAHRVHAGNTPAQLLYEGSLRLSRLHLDRPGRSPAARRLLRERELDALWGLGRFAEARRRAWAHVAVDPALLAHPRFRKLLLASVLPAPLLRALRERQR